MFVFYSLEMSLQISRLPQRTVNKAALIYCLLIRILPRKIDYWSLALRASALKDENKWKSHPGMNKCSFDNLFINQKEIGIGKKENKSNRKSIRRLRLLSFPSTTFDKARKSMFPFQCYWFNLLKLFAVAERGKKINFVFSRKVASDERQKGTREENWKKGKLTEGNCLFAVQWLNRLV